MQWELIYRFGLGLWFLVKEMDLVFGQKYIKSMGDLRTLFENGMEHELRV